MRIWHISDTHTFHNLLTIPQGIDIVIHSGDCSNPRDPYTNEPEVRDFIHWFKSLPIQHKIYVAGNHDTSIEKKLITKKDFQDYNDDIVPIKALSFHAFFVYLAIQARQKIFDEAVKAQLKTNPHPMDKYRTNCPLARLELFRSLYNIKKKDKMFWASTDTIW